MVVIAMTSNGVRVTVGGRSRLWSGGWKDQKLFGAEPSVERSQRTGSIAVHDRFGRVGSTVALSPGDYEVDADLPACDLVVAVRSEFETIEVRAQRDGEPHSILKLRVRAMPGNSEPVSPVTLVYGMRFWEWMSFVGHSEARLGDFFQTSAIVGDLFAVSMLEWIYKQDSDSGPAMNRDDCAVLCAFALEEGASLLGA